MFITQLLMDVYQSKYVKHFLVIGCFHRFLKFNMFRKLKNNDLSVYMFYFMNCLRFLSPDLGRIPVSMVVVNKRLILSCISTLFLISFMKTGPGVGSHFPYRLQR